MDKLNYTRIGLNIKLIRISRGYSLDELSKLLGIDYKSLNHYENGRKIKLEILIQICVFFEYKLDDLINKDAKIDIRFE